MVTASGWSMPSMILSASRTPKHIPRTSATRTFMLPPLPENRILFMFRNCDFIRSCTLQHKVFGQKKSPSGRGPSLRELAGDAGVPGRAQGVGDDAFQHGNVFEKALAAFRGQPAQGLRAVALEPFPDFDEPGLLQDLQVP